MRQCVLACASACVYALHSNKLVGFSSSFICRHSEWPSATQAAPRYSPHTLSPHTHAQWSKRGREKKKNTNTHFKALIISTLIIQFSWGSWRRVNRYILLFQSTLGWEYTEDRCSVDGWNLSSWSSFSPFLFIIEIITVILALQLCTDKWPVFKMIYDQSYEAWFMSFAQV